MTATTTTTALPRNRTGVFAGDTLQQVKPIQNQANVVPVLPPQYRQSGFAGSVLTLTEQNRLVRNVPNPNNTTYERRNGFRPSAIRRQNARAVSAMTRHDDHHRDVKDVLSKELIYATRASARLRSEIDQLNSQLKIYGDLNKILRLQSNRDASTTSRSALSYSTSYRLSSASTQQTASRLHTCFSSVLTNTGTMTNVSSKSVAGLSSPSYGDEKDQYEIDHSLSHAFQIPQQSNVGSESIFPLNPSSLPTSQTRSSKLTRYSNETKPSSCPFYVMYFTNLALQQRSNSSKRVSSSGSAATARKSTANSRYSSSQRAVDSPISIATYSTIDGDHNPDVSSTPYYNNKRFSARMTAFETENSHLLKDVLRTTSWNHVQV